MKLSVIAMIILGFTLVVVGLGLLSAIAPIVSESTAPVGYSQTIDFTSARLVNGTINGSVEFPITQLATSWRTEIDDCLPGTNGDFKLANSSGTLFTLTTDYTVTGPGVIKFVNSAAVNGSATNLSTASYSYCNNEYTSGWGATILKLVVGFGGLAILAVGIMIFFQIFRDLDVI